MFGRILVGTDGSGTAAGAVRHAVDLAKATGAELIVMSVYGAPKDAPSPFGEPDAGPAGIEVAKGLLEDVQKHYGDEVKLRTLAREGHAADAIIDTCAEERVDVVVVGNRGMTGAKRYVLGSVPNAVSHHAPCHVLIVHTTEE